MTKAFLFSERCFLGRIKGRDPISSSPLKKRGDKIIWSISKSPSARPESPEKNVTRAQRLSRCLFSSFYWPRNSGEQKSSASSFAFFYNYRSRQRPSFLLFCSLFSPGDKVCNKSLFFSFTKWQPLDESGGPKMLFLLP